MKILKILLYLVGALALIAVVLGLTGPKSFDVHRSTIVAGTPEQVWPYVSNLKNMALWSPWAEKDTAMVVEYTGTDGAVGSMSSWSGNSDVGEGSQTISKLEPNSYAETELKFLKPMENGFTGYISLKDTTGGTFVDWGMKGENGFVGRIMGSLMNLDKMMAPDFERGLSKLTAIMASMPKKEGPSFNIVTGDYPGGKYLGVRGAITMDKITEFFGKNFPALFPALEKAGGKPASMPMGLYYSWDEAEGTTELVAAVACTGDFKAPAGMEIVTLPASRSLTIDYYGGYNGVGQAHMAMEAYINENKLEALTPAAEEYITDPGSEPDSTKWLTKIVYFVK
jgi:effector-binding domain-containing protein